MARRAFLAGGAALAAFAASGCAVPRPRRIEAANPPRGRFTQADGLRVHHVEMGPPDAPPVILIHGATGNLNDMTFDLAPRLAEDHRVIAFDRPGLGYTERPDALGWRPQTQAAILREAAGRLGVSRPVVLGHSWGAAAALAWALQAPDLRGLVLVSGATRPWGGGPGPLTPIITSRPVAAVTASIAWTMAMRDGGRSAARRIFEPQDPPEGYLDHLQAELIARPASFRANTEDIERLAPELADMAPGYPALPMPAEILHGLADDITSPRIHSVELAGRMRDARLHLFEGVGHMLHHARAEETAAAVRRLSA
jgi:pimeloyl-ACP methyl ester carboxylesterase